MHNEPLGGIYLERYYLKVVMASDAVALLSILKKSLGIKLAVSNVLEPGAPKIKETYKKKTTTKTKLKMIKTEFHTPEKSEVIHLNVEFV